MIRENHLFAAEEEEEKEKKEEEMEFGAHIARPRRLCFLPSQLAGWGYTVGEEEEGTMTKTFPSFPFLA